MELYSNQEKIIDKILSANRFKYIIEKRYNTTTHYILIKDGYKMGVIIPNHLYTKYIYSYVNNIIKNFDDKFKVEK